MRTELFVSLAFALVPCRIRFDQHGRRDRRSSGDKKPDWPKEIGSKYSYDGEHTIHLCQCIEVRETLLYRGGVVSSSSPLRVRSRTIARRRLARFSLLSEVGAMAAT